MHDTYRHGYSTPGSRAGWLTRALSTGALLAVVTVSAWAQGLTGTVTGTVKDATGGVVPGATVVLISEGQKTRTSPVVTNVWRLRRRERQRRDLHGPGGDAVVQDPASSGVSVGPGSRVSVGTLTIEVGGATETVTVTSEVPVIQTTSGERSFRVEPDAVSSLPLANRSYDALLALAPGVDSSPGSLTPRPALDRVPAATSCWMARRRWIQA